MKHKNNLARLLEFDNSFIKSFTDYYFVGVDEVGRGSLAGPVIACAFTWRSKEIVSNLSNKKNSFIVKLNDSKQLNSFSREKIHRSLIRLGIFGLGYASVKEIEMLNILNASFLAMKRAFENLVLSLNADKNKANKGKMEPYLLIDGNKFNPYINCRQSSVIAGDAKSSLIASASIIAKVYRDNLMKKISALKKLSRYGWSTNVGYATAFHRMAIKKHGLTPFHRKLFVRKIVAF